MNSMFYNAFVFDQDISNWNVSNVTNMSGMFTNCEFNQPIGNWDVSSLKDTRMMFNSSPKFDQNLGSWDISSMEHMDTMFNNNNLSTANYNATLKGWSELGTGETQIPVGITFGGANSKYTSSAEYENEETH